MNILKLCLSYALLLLPLTAFSAGRLTSHQVLVDCNKSASSLVESYEKDVPLQDSKRLDLIQLISGTCQYGYKNAYEGMQYPDIERTLLAEAKKANSELKGEKKNNADYRVGLILAAVQAGYYIYNNGGLENKN